MFIRSFYKKNILLSLILMVIFANPAGAIDYYRVVFGGNGQYAPFDQLPALSSQDCVQRNLGWTAAREPLPPYNANVEGHDYYFKCHNDTYTSYSFTIYRVQNCPSGQEFDPSEGECVTPPAPLPLPVDKNPLCLKGGNPPTPPASNGGDNPWSLNPCDFRTGAKYRHETDFSSGSFTLTRNYHSSNLADVGFGIGWHNRYLKRLSVSSSNDALDIREGTGRGESWRKENGVWVGDADSDYLVTESTSGYAVTLKRGDVHEYDLSGRLLSETDTQGKVMSYEYDAENRLISVNNHYQQTISFIYSIDGKNHVVKVIDALGAEYGYEYDANDNLTAVVYPDGDSDPLNNPKRIYHYENTTFPNHITGITNANGERYATFAYDANGKAIESALAPTTNSVGQQRVQLQYQGAN